MKKFFRVNASAIPALAAILFFALGAARCTSVDDTLGQNFVPPHQQMRLRIDTLTGGISTFIAQNDTVLSSNQGFLYLGRMTDPVFGKVRASAMTDFFPQGIYANILAETDEDDTSTTFESQDSFGFNAVADSVFLDLVISDIDGTPKPGQKINIYQMRDSLQRDTVYFFSTPIEKNVDRDKPLFSFTISDEAVVGSLLTIQLDVTAEGEEFLTRIVETDKEIFEEPLYTFHKRFYGLYMAPADDYPEDGATYSFYLRSLGENRLYSSFVVWAHNFDEANPTQVKDIMTGYFRLSDTDWFPNPNLNVNRTEFEYPAAIADHLNDTLQTSVPLETVYVQNMGGVATYLRFTDDFIENMNKLKTVDGETYSALVVNEARLFFPMDDPTVDYMNAAPARLGMYYTYGQPRAEYGTQYTPFFSIPYYNVTPVYGPKPILDYTYYTENRTSSPAKSPYDGYLFRSEGQGFYRMNITYYLTLLLNYPDSAPRDIWLGGEVNTRHRDYTQVVLKGSESPDENIRLVLTYTLVK